MSWLTSCQRVLRLTSGGMGFMDRHPKQWLAAVIILCAYSGFSGEIRMLEAQESLSVDQEFERLVNRDTRDKTLEELRKRGAEAVPVLVRALNSEDPHVLEDVLKLLEGLGPKAAPAAPALVHRFKGLDWPLDNNVSHVLEKIGQPAMPALISGLADENQQVRDGAVSAMFNLLGSPEESISIPKTVIPSLLKILACRQGCGQYAGRDAAYILGKMGDDARETVPALVEALRQGNENTRYGAALALGEIHARPELAIPALMDATLNDSNSDNRQGAAQSLQNWAMYGQVGSTGKEAVPTLIRMLSAPTRYSKISASAVLGAIGPDAKDAVPALIQELDSTKNEDIRRSFALALGEIGYPAIGDLLKALSDKDPALRRYAAQALGDINVSRIPHSQLANIKLQLLAAQANLKNASDVQPEVKDAVNRVLEEVNGVTVPLTEGEIRRSRGLIVQIDGQLGGDPVIGSGIVFGSLGSRLYIATARHLCRKELQSLESPLVSLRDLPGESLKAQLLEQSDKDLDLAVLMVDVGQRNRLQTAEIDFDRMGKPEALKADEKVFALGLPREQTDLPVQPDQFVKAVGFRIIFQSSSVKEGYSGGGLFDSNWRLVGMIRAVDPPFGYAISIDQIIAQLKDWGYPVNLVSHKQ